MAMIKAKKVYVSKDVPTDSPKTGMGAIAIGTAKDTAASVKAATPPPKVGEKGYTAPKGYTGQAQQPKTKTSTPKAKSTAKPAKVTYTKTARKSSKDLPLPVDASPGKLDKSDVARAKTYVARLQGSSLGHKRTAAQEAAFQKYSGRAKSYAARLDKKKTPAASKK